MEEEILVFPMLAVAHHQLSYLRRNISTKKTHIFCRLNASKVSRQSRCPSDLIPYRECSAGVLLFFLLSLCTGHRSTGQYSFRLGNLVRIAHPERASHPFSAKMLKGLSPAARMRVTSSSLKVRALVCGKMVFV